MGTTANRSYPYPDPADPADFAGGMEALARAVDTDVQALVDLTTAPALSVFSGVSFVSLASGVETAATYSVVDYSNGAGTLGSGANRVNVVIPGTYLLHFSFRAPDTTTELDAFIRVNTTDFGRALHEGNAPAQPRLTVIALAPNLIAGDIITTTAVQNTGALATTLFGPRLMMYKVA